MEQREEPELIDSEEVDYKMYCTLDKNNRLVSSF